ncbi:lysoplasmalogenase [Undibacterium sp. 10I3]|uniref:lysoplasmalogenase n=1 Tax=Undibacterium sp. 10I3 TaxID=3048579 RepID=UPI002B23140F|nr:lysoplasmalogenase [Undibacterium sp. 10I3]MEB0231721.1 lysoplasmalogenase [Undibacterium sp. 10I3]
MLKLSLIVLAAALAIFGAAEQITGQTDHLIWLHYAFKPLTTLLIFWVAFGVRHFNVRYRKAILIGILFSLMGDVFLMLPLTLFKSGFLLGLASFLLAHLCFLRAFISDTRLVSRPWIFLVIGMIGVINLIILWPGIPGELRVPVVVYVVCLLCMTSQALARHLVLKTKASKLAMAGGLAFMLSDTLLAYNKFNAPLPHAALLILATYYLALYLIAPSVKTY